MYNKIHGEVVLLTCVDETQNTIYALGWWDEVHKEWVVTARPVNEYPIEITYWCRLPSIDEKYRVDDPWPLT